MIDVTTIGAILTYSTSGVRCIGGQTIGANGAGEFAVIFPGQAMHAEMAAHQYLRDLKRSGHMIHDASVVANEQLYSGPAIRVHCYDQDGSASGVP